MYFLRKVRKKYLQFTIKIPSIFRAHSSNFFSPFHSSQNINRSLGISCIWLFHSICPMLPHISYYRWRHPFVHDESTRWGSRWGRNMAMHCEILYKSKSMYLYTNYRNMQSDMREQLILLFVIFISFINCLVQQQELVNLKWWPGSFV